MCLADLNGDRVLDLLALTGDCRVGWLPGVPVLDPTSSDSDEDGLCDGYRTASGVCAGGADNNGAVGGGDCGAKDRSGRSRGSVYG